MPNVNKVILCGNLTRDVDLKSLASGDSVGAFGLAVNKKWRDKSGETKERVTFVDCVIWGKRAEALARFVGKGDPLFIDGELVLEQWDKEGQRQSKLRVHVNDFQFMGGERREQAPQREPQRKPAVQEAPAYDDSDIPF